ncbi:MAG: hypothetical protein C0596_14955 [Marinilabiliales bacterium]|nr:MAG: hypothetical protein C0596_14955 [Marinilabiliales bacterium]
MLTVTDNCGDEVYETIEVTGVEHPEVNLLTLQDTLCPASFDGIIDLEVDMVCGSVIYSWVGPNGFISTNQNISGLEAGEYFLSVTDDNGTFETSYSLMDPSPDALSLTYSTSPAICDLNRSVTNVTLHMLGINAGGMYCSGADGEFELTINGTYTYNDFFPYEDNGCGVINDFMLDPGAVAAIMDGLNTFEINSQPSGMGGVEALGWVALQIDFDDSSSEIVMINGDISEVGFDWCATASTQNLGVCFGNHYASSSAEIVFTQGGGIDLIVDGGVMPMSYNWSDGGTYTSTDEDIFGIPVGTYIVTVTDYCGQTASESIEITGVSQPDVQVVELIEPMCPGNFNGSITIEPTISCGTITYEWAGPNGFTSTDQNIAGLEAGEYFLSVTDNNGMLETSYLINDPESLPVNISYTTSPAVCMTPRSVTGLSLEVMAVNTNGMDCVPTDGEFSLTINGGYTYTDYMPFDPTYCGVIQSFTLDAAAYSTILDGENNTIFNCQPSGVLGLDYLGWAVLHIDYDDGTSEDLVVAGAYEEVGMTFCAGANWYGYGACGTVVHNATVYASFTVGGSIDLTVDDAQLPCTFNLSDGGTFTSTDEDLFNIPQGTYNVTVTDACGTTSEEIIVLDGLSGPEFDLLSSEDPYCPGAFDGSIEIEILVNCGIPSYNWEGPNSFTSTDKDIYGLEACVYNLTVTDDNGVSIETYELFDPTPLPLNVSAIVVPELCTTSRTITSATFHLMGFDEFSECPFWGTDTDGTYEFSINGNTVVSSSVSAIGNSCGDIYSTPIDPFDLAYIVHGDNEFSLNIYPLPNTGLANLSWAYLEISYDDNSTEYFGIIGGGYEAYQSGVDLCNTPPSGNACGGQSFFTGTHEVELSFSGGVVLDITEGIEPYIIDWDNDGTGDFDDNQVLYPVASGTYNLTVQDACGDEVNDTYTIDPATGPYVFEPETIIELPTCPGGADGSIEIEVVGSCGENTFSWEDDANPGVEIATTEDLFDIAAGNYTLYATNDNGTETYNFVVDDPVIDPLDLSISASMIDCQVSGVRSVSSCDLRWLATDCSGGAENMALYINGIEAFNDLVDPLALCECDPGYEGSFVINDPVVLASIIEGNNEFYLDYNNTQAISYAVLTLNFDDASSQEIILLSTINGNIGDFGTDICSYNYYTYSTALVEENVTLHPGFAVTDLIVNGGVEPYEYIWDDNDNSTTNNIYISEVGNYSVTVNDYCGQTATIDVDVVIDDFDAPVVPILADITADCSVTVVAPTASDCVGDVTGTTLDPIFYDTQGTYTITWEFDDGHGNTSSTTQTVIIDDLTGPIPDLAVLDDVTAECEVSVLVEPTATDACGGAVTVTHDAILPITDQGTTIVIWTYEDQYGNESTQMQNVVIQDVTGPTPDIATLDDITAECEVTSLVEPTATDNCGGFVNVSNDATLPINTQGTTEITWIFEDQYGNLSTQTQNVVIEDITHPVADNALLDDVLAECEVTSLIAPTATDNCGGIVNVSNDAVLPIIAQGTTVVTWTYADENGNETIQTQNIVIDDITSPVPDLVVLDDITTECSVTVLTPPNATDNCGGEVLVSHDATLPITSQGTTVVIWTYDDGNGNSVTQEQNVIIEDITSPNPDVAFLPDLVDNCMISSLTDPSATDNCGGTVIVTHDADLPIYGTSTITWTYDDGNGNTSTQTQEVIINDITPPTPDLLVLDDITDECIVTDLVEPTATDDCGGTVTVTHDATLPITLQGTTLVTWTYADENGNETTQTQNVVIEDISAPIPDIAVLDDVTAECEV